jgi:hypothetical protein
MRMPSLGEAPAADLDRVIDEIVQADAQQLSRAEYRYVADLVTARGGCNLLVFGVGNDTGLWLLANAAGRTVFLESSPFWGELIGWRHPEADVRMIRYGTRVGQWRELLDGPAAHLEIDLPEDVARGRWDVVLVDGPSGSSATSPGRMKSIYTASVLAAGAPGADVVVHDCDREVERAYCDRFLGGARWVRELEKTRHYRAPGAADGEG